MFSLCALLPNKKDTASPHHINMLLNMVCYLGQTVFLSSATLTHQRLVYGECLVLMQLESVYYSIAIIIAYFIKDCQYIFAT